MYEGFRTSVRVVAVIAGVGLTMIGCQAYDTMASAVEARDKAVEAWMAANPEQALMAERHVRSCQFSLSARNRDSDEGDTRMTFTECLEQAGAVSLAQSVQQAVEQVHRPLPLRMFSSS